MVIQMRENHNNCENKVYNGTNTYTIAYADERNMCINAGIDNKNQNGKKVTHNAQNTEEKIYRELQKKN